MVHSKRCILRGLDSIQLSELGECPYDQGRLFYHQGKRKGSDLTRNQSYQYSVYQSIVRRRFSKPISNRFLYMIPNLRPI